jgi:hypothetical protein
MLARPTVQRRFFDVVGLISVSAIGQKRAYGFSLILIRKLKTKLF